MLAWRLCRAPYADLLGDGARRFGGRWNSPGWPVVYAASNPALAVLEVRVHLDLPPELLPDDYVLVTIDLGDLSVEDLAQMPAAPRTFGDTWLQEQRTPVLRNRATEPEFFTQSDSSGGDDCPCSRYSPVRI